MASNEMTDYARPIDGPTPLTAREKRKRILALSLLLLLLFALAFAAYSWYRNRQVPVPTLGREDGALNPPTYLFSITGKGASELKKPVGVGVAENGRVYVVDFGNHRISVFDARGRFLFSFNKVAKGKVLGNPVHLQVKGKEVWVTDRRLRGVFVFGLDGKFLRQFEPKNEKLTWTPLALAFDSAGSLRTTDVGNTRKHRLIYFSQDGSRTATVGKTKQVNGVQQEPGSFYFPNGLAVAKDGRVFVADGDNRRVQVFDKSGKFIKFVDTSGVPRGLAIDAKNRLYVVDALAHTVDLYSLEGEHLVGFGTRGFGPGEFNFPNDVAIARDGRIYVSDRENNQVQVWGWPALVVPATVIPTQPWQWMLCFLPLLLLPLVWLLTRKRRYVLTPAIVSALDTEGMLAVLRKRKLRFIAPEFDRAAYEALKADGVDVLTDHLVSFDEYSPSDVAALSEKLRCTEQQAIYLVMADRVRGLLSGDVELRRLGMVARVRVLDADEFLEDVGERRSA